MGIYATIISSYLIFRVASWRFSKHQPHEVEPTARRILGFRCSRCDPIVAGGRNLATSDPAAANFSRI